MARGDHIYVSRGLYTHHGIDCGDGTVIHYTGEPGRKAEARVRRDPLARFANGRPIHIRGYSGRTYPPEEVVRRAERRLGRRNYKLSGNNCEHFATWCVCGEHTSKQVDRAVPRAAAAQAAGAGGGALMIVSSAGTVSGLSGSGVMSGLAATGLGGAAGGVATLAGSAGAGAVLLMNSTVLADNPELEASERKARKNGRVASTAAAALSTAGGVAAISAMGTTAGLSAAGISSGLAAIGTASGAAAATGASAMVAGTAVVVAAPAIAATAIGFGLYKLTRWRR